MEEGTCEQTKDTMSNEKNTSKRSRSGIVVDREGVNNDSGGSFTRPNITTGQFTRLAFTYQSASNQIDSVFSAAAASQGALTNAGTLFAGLDGTPIGFVDLEATAAFNYKTAGASTNVIEDAQITRFGSG